MADDPASYPVNIDLETDLGARNRLTVGFRPILAVPHMFLSGFVGSTGNVGASFGRGDGDSEKGEYVSKFHVRESVKAST